MVRSRFWDLVSLSTAAVALGVGLVVARRWMPDGVWLLLLVALFFAPEVARRLRRSREGGAGTTIGGEAEAGRRAGVRVGTEATAIVAVAVVVGVMRMVQGRLSAVDIIAIVLFVLVFAGGRVLWWLLRREPRSR